MKTIAISTHKVSIDNSMMQNQPVKSLVIINGGIQSYLNNRHNAIFGHLQSRKNQTKLNIIQPFSEHANLASYINGWWNL